MGLVEKISDFFLRIDKSYFGIAAAILFALLVAVLAYFMSTKLPYKVLVSKIDSGHDIVEFVTRVRGVNTILAAKIDGAQAHVALDRALRSRNVLGIVSLVLLALLMALCLALANSSDLADQKRLARAAQESLELITQSNAPGMIISDESKLNGLLHAFESIRSPEIMINSGNIRAELHDFSNAVADYECALDLGKSVYPPRVREKKLASIQADIATTYVDMGKYSEAEAALIEASRLNENDGRPVPGISFLIHYTRGRMLVTKINNHDVEGQAGIVTTKAAVKEFAACENLAGSSIPAAYMASLRLNEATLMMLSKLYDQAARVCEDGLTYAFKLRSPVETSLRSNKVAIDILKKDYAKAEKDIRPLLDVVGSLDDQTRAPIEYQEATLRALEGDWSGAILWNGYAESHAKGTTLGEKAAARKEKLSRR